MLQKRKKTKYTTEQLHAAIASINAGMSLSKASAQFSIPKATLHKKVAQNQRDAVHKKSEQSKRKTNETTTNNRSQLVHDNRQSTQKKAPETTTNTTKTTVHISGEELLQRFKSILYNSMTGTWNISIDELKAITSALNAALKFDKEFTNVADEDNVLQILIDNNKGEQQ